MDVKSGPSGDIKLWPVDDWTWNKGLYSCDVELSSDYLSVYFHTSPLLESHSVAGIRSNRGFREGEHYWEIRFTEAAYGVSMMVGICTDKAALHSDDIVHQANLIGADESGWGLSYKGFLWHNGQKRRFCEPFYLQNTVIGFHLNLYNGTLTVYKNGELLGIAAEGLHLLDEDIYAAACSTAVDTELEVSNRTCRYLSLQEKCCRTIAGTVKRKADLDSLPLPPVMKRHLKSLT